MLVLNGKTNITAIITVDGEPYPVTEYTISNGCVKFNYLGLSHEVCGNYQITRVNY